MIRFYFSKRNFNLFHLSWTYIKTIGQLLLFKNEDDIKDEDQVEIMKEVMHYMSDSRSGVNGFNQMSEGWSKVSEDIRNMKQSDKNDLENAVVSWHQEVEDLKLMLSRHLGVTVKSRTHNPIKKLATDIQSLKKENCLSTSLEIKHAPSNIEIKAEFERRMIQMSVEIIPDLDYKTLEGRFDAVKIVRAGSEIIGGKGGGGRTDFAQAGGTLPDKIQESFENIKKLIN